MDNDELYRHLRRDHLYCHFCDADGYHRYYCSYPDLRDHFRDEHYLCEEGACVGEQFTSVFRSDIDLKAHKANVHLRQLGKAAAKQARTLELEFTLSPRGDRGSRRNDRGPGRSYHNQELVEYPAPEPPAEITFAKQPQVDVQSTEQFPTLGNTAPIIPVISHGKTRGNLTIRSRLGQPMITDEDFPALAGPEAPSCSGMSNTLNVSVSQAQPNSGPSNVSIHVNHKSNGTVTTRVSGNNIRIRPTRADFPALGSSEPLTMAPNVGQWTKVTAKIKPKEIEHRTRNSAVISTPSIQSGSDFPCLKPKSNRSSVSIVPSQSNFATNSNDPTKGKTKKKKNTKSGNNEVKKVEVAKSHETSDSKKNDKKKTKSAEENPEVTLANSNNVQRKRSEIKIEGLASTNNNVVMRSEDFPALGNPKASPPGLAKPPPGFGAPPGFSSKQVNDNRLTFTNSSGESYAIVPNESHSRQYVYTPPTDFQRRNKNLVASVNEALDNEESIKEFRYLSGLFRQGVCDPQEFYIRCRTSMGISTFEKIFPELLLLLPDIEKQRELFSIHKTESSGKARGLEECTTCGQIVRGSELKSHKSCHDLEKHFPALDIGAQSNSWARKWVMIVKEKYILLSIVLLVAGNPTFCMQL